MDSHASSESTKTPKRRRRPPLACKQCRRRKVRCDRRQPCNHCSHGGQSAECTYAAKASITGSTTERQEPRTLLASHVGSPAVGEEPTSHRSPTYARLAPRLEYREPTLDYIDDSASGSVPAAIASSRTGSITSSNSQAFNVDYLVKRVQSLEADLAKSKRFVGEDHGRSGKSRLNDVGAPVRGIISKTRYFGPSHWMNGADLVSGFHD